MTTDLITFEYRGQQVVFDPAARMWNLNAMHRAAGGVAHKAPRQWMTRDQTQEFIAALTRKLYPQGYGLEEGKLDQIWSSLVVVREGRGGGTWAHWQIAAAYAHYLNPEFYIQWNEWAMERVQQLRAAPQLGTPELPRLEAYKPKHVEAAQQVEELVRRIPECMEFTGDENDRIEPYDLARGLGNRGVKLPCIGEFRGYLVIERALEILGVKRSYYLVPARRGFRKNGEYFWYGVRWAPVEGRMNWDNPRRA